MLLDIAAILALSAHAPVEAAAAPPSTLDDAVRRYGPPTLRQPRADGGQKLRWVRPRDSLLAIMDVATVEVDAAGKVLKAETRTVAMKSPTGY